MDFDQSAKDVSESARLLNRAAPETMRGYRALGAAAYADRVLSKKIKELIALAISISTRCDGCVAYHARQVALLGATREEVCEVAMVAVQMGGGPGMVYAGQALRAFDTFRKEVAVEAAE
jgi:AhpD family alkylhydroperoxidase